MLILVVVTTTINNIGYDHPGVTLGTTTQEQTNVRVTLARPVFIPSTNVFEIELTLVKF